MAAFSRAKLKRLNTLNRKKGRGESATFLVEGVRAIREALGSSFDLLECYYTGEAMENPEVIALIADAKRRTGTVEQVTSREIAAVAETVHAQGILAVLRQREISLEMLIGRTDEESLLVALDAVTDPGNVGTIIRTCDWFGVHGIMLGKQSVDLYNPKVVRGTMGSVFHVPVACAVDLPAALSAAREAEYSIYVADAGGETHFDRVRYARKAVLVFGNEAWGVSDAVRQLADFRVSIRRYGSAESLNVGVSCGILLSTVHRLTDL